MHQPDASPGPVTRLLREWRGGNREALDRLIPLVYSELRGIASRHRSREWRAGSLEATAIVNEAYLKLVGRQRVDWQNRAHFFAIAAELMRRILVDDARRRLREKRGSGEAPLALEEAPIAAPDTPVDQVDVIALDRAL